LVRERQELFAQVLAGVETIWVKNSVNLANVVSLFAVLTGHDLLRL